MMVVKEVLVEGEALLVVGLILGMEVKSEEIYIVEEPQWRSTCVILS